LDHFDAVEGFSVGEAGYFVINPRVLDAHDPDTAPELVLFKLTRLPEHGVLQYDTLAMSPGSQFTTTDVKNELVAYVTRKKSPSGTDSFQLEVTDGVHKVPVTVHVKLSDILQSDSPFVEFLPPGMPVEVPMTPKRVSVTTMTNITEEIEEIVVVEERRETFDAGGLKVPQIDLVDLEKPLIEDILPSSSVSMVEVVEKNILAPVLEIRNALVVEEGQKSQINVTHVDVTDGDTPRADLRCSIVDQPSHGYVETSKSTAVPVSSFTLGDVDAGRLNYVQNLHAGVEPTHDTFGFHCTDGVNYSDKKTFVVIIRPVNDEPPHFFARDFAVMEGMDLIIDMTLLR
jgi:hypothetical protein